MVTAGSQVILGSRRCGCVGATGTHIYVQGSTISLNEGLVCGDPLINPLKHWMQRTGDFARRPSLSGTYRLVVKGSNDSICALLVLKDNLGNDDRVRLDQPTATDQATHGCHGALYIGSCCARREVLSHHHERSGQSPDGNAGSSRLLRRRWANMVDMLLRRRRGRCGSGVCISKLSCAIRSCRGGLGRSGARRMNAGSQRVRLRLLLLRSELVVSGL